MTTIEKMNQANTSEELIKVLLEIIDHKEFTEVSTCPCDSYGWSKKTHALIQKIQRQQLLKGFHISCKYKFEVYDWMIVKDSSCE